MLGLNIYAMKIKINKHIEITIIKNGAIRKSKFNEIDVTVFIPMI